jgi:hypothetical protein
MPYVVVFFVLIQEHEYEYPLRLHFPPFLHGFGRHRFLTETNIIIIIIIIIVVVVVVVVLVVMYFKTSHLT